MAKCKHCGSERIVSQLLPTYEDDLLGTPFPVILVNAVTEEQCGECGAVLGHSIPNLDGLIAAVAVTRALNPMKLNGEEIRFLRKAAGWKAKDVAEALGQSPEHISRCENGFKVFAPAPERLLRALIWLELQEKAPLIKCDAEALRNMRISPVRVADETLRFKFELVRVQGPTRENEDQEVRYKKAA